MRESSRNSSPQPRLRQRRAGGPLVVPETPLRALIDEWLGIADIEHTVTDAALVVAGGQVRRSSVTRSWPDVTFCAPLSGRLGLIEIKAEDGSYQPGQLERIERLRSRGAWVLEPRSLEDVVDAFTNEYGDRLRWPALFHLRRAIAAYRQGVGAR